GPGEPTTLRLPGPPGVFGEVLARHPQVFRRVDGEPDALVPERAQAPSGRELRERARLVVAALGEALERLFAEHVDAAADPLVEARGLSESGDEVVVEGDHTEGRAQGDDGDGRGRLALAMQRQQLRKVDVDQLVAVQREDVSLLAPGLRRIANP